MSYTKFSDRFCPGTPANLAKPAKGQENSSSEPAKVLLEFAKVGQPDSRPSPTLANFSDRILPRDAQKERALAGLATFATRHPQIDFSEPTVIAPAALSGATGRAQPLDEPSFDQPCEARRGRVVREGGLFLHFCIDCGAWGAYGHGVLGTSIGRWYCGEHRPSNERR